MTGDLNIKKHGDYEFACWYWQTSNAWGHEVRLCKVGERAGVEVGKARVRYYNRTWERYTYQSAMYSALDNYEQSERARFLKNYKCSIGLEGYDTDKHEWFEKPFKRGQKAQALAEFAETDTAKDIKALKEYIEKGE